MLCEQVVPRDGRKEEVPRGGTKSRYQEEEEGGSDRRLPDSHPGLTIHALPLSVPRSPCQQATGVSFGTGENGMGRPCESILSQEERAQVSVNGDGDSQVMMLLWTC